MGAGRRRIDRRLSRAVTPLPPVAIPDPRWLTPALALAYAGATALTLLAADQLSAYLPGAWFEMLGIGVLVLAGLTVFLLLRDAWRRHRELLRQRAVVSIAGAIGATLIGLVAVYGLVENAKVTSVISGADVHLTRPVLESLPRPPGTRVLDESPGIAGTETISMDMAPPDLKTVVPFYERELTRLGWTEDKTSATTAIVRFARGEFLVSVATDPPSGDYTISVDRFAPTPSASASASPSPGASNSAAPSPG